MGCSTAPSAGTRRATRAVVVPSGRRGRRRRASPTARPCTSTRGRCRCAAATQPTPAARWRPASCVPCGRCRCSGPRPGRGAAAPARRRCRPAVGRARGSGGATAVRAAQARRRIEPWARSAGRGAGRRGRPSDSA
eukprot:5684883-Prymnesium_polylepis.1